MRPSNTDLHINGTKSTERNIAENSEQEQYRNDHVRSHDFASQAKSSKPNVSDVGFEASEKTKQMRPGILPRPSSIGRRLSFIDDEELRPEISHPEKAGTVSWSELPNKGQLAILTLARLSEPLTQTSLQAYMFYQLKSFGPSLPDSTIASQAGILQGSFTAAQFFTAVLWGRAADSDWGGRKKVILIGLAGTCLSCVGFGFSRSFLQAACFRVMGGALNGNVGVMRTMISEIIKEKKYQSRAFLLLPMCFNIGVIIGPVLGGLLADPVGSYPSFFGDESIFGGKTGVWWMKHWPYALPNLVSAVFLFSAAGGVIFGLEETLDSLQDKPDPGLRTGRFVASLLRRLFKRTTHRYTAIQTQELSPISYSSGIESYDLESSPTNRSHTAPTDRITPHRKLKLPFRQIWTRNVLFTLLCHAILALHVGTFNNLWFIFLSTPRFNPSAPIPPSHTDQALPWSFTGGLGMPPRSIGAVLACLGLIGITLQLAVYPTVNTKLGTLRSYRYFLVAFPLAYCLAPYLAVVPSSTLPPSQASGFRVYSAIAGVLFVQVLARTFALPAAIILMNNCTPHPSVLGTVHGISHSVSSASRTVGPMLGGWLYGQGLKAGVVGGVWWALAGVASLGWVASGWIYEGSGHEIWLEGEKDEERNC